MHDGTYLRTIFLRTNDYPGTDELCAYVLLSEYKGTWLPLDSLQFENCF